MFVTAEKERRMFIIFCLSIFLRFELEQAECVQTLNALTNQPRSQLFLI